MPTSQPVQFLADLARHAFLRATDSINTVITAADLPGNDAMIVLLIVMTEFESKRRVLLNDLPPGFADLFESSIIETQEKLTEEFALLKQSVRGT